MNRDNVINALSDVALSHMEMEFTFNIKTQHGTGTCFLYGNDHGFFYVTARHLFENVRIGENIFLSHARGWLPWTIAAIFLPDDAHDFVVFVTNQPVGGSRKFSTDFQVLPGQPVKFLGFPHNLTNNFPSSSGYMTPLVRSAHFSGMINYDGLMLTVLDGFNNPGYSGGPVYCCGNDGSTKLFGIISSYRNELESHSRLYKKNSEGIFEPVPDYMVKLNSGMIYVTGKAEFMKLFSKVDRFQPPYSL